MIRSIYEEQGLRTPELLRLLAVKAELSEVPQRAVHAADAHEHAALARAHDVDVGRLRAVGDNDLAVPAVVHEALGRMT